MRIRRFLGMLAVIMVVGGLTVVIDGYLGSDSNQASDQVITSPDGTPPDATAAPTSSTTSVPAELPSGQVRLEGHVSGVHLEGAVVDPRLLNTPLTLVSDRGFGNGGELTGVTVDGQPSSIVWDGGRPFVLASGPGLKLGPVTVDLVADGLRLQLGTTPHPLEPGSYQLDTPVAVGSSGIATSRDAVAFEAGPDAQLEAHGDAALTFGPNTPHHFTGPGRVQIDGDLTVTDAQGTRQATSVTSPEGAFDLTFTPGPDGSWTVTGLAPAP